MLAYDDEDGGDGHGDDIGNEEELGYSIRNWVVSISVIQLCRCFCWGRVEIWRWFALTMSVVMEVDELIAPLRYYSQGILEKCHDDEKTADRWEVSVGVQ